MRSFILALWLLLAAAPAARAIDLTVRLDGLEDRGGSLRVGLFASAEGFARRRAGVIATHAVAAEGTSVVIRFAGLTPGRYAVTAFHDENDNRRLDRLLGLLPGEGVALSNDPALLLPPSFDDLAVEVRGSREVTLRMRYVAG